MNAPQTPAWWFIAGDVIHKASEDADIDGCTDPSEATAYFMSNWNNTMQRLKDDGVNTADIAAGGRKTTQWPDKENERFWLANGPGMVAAWIQWRTLMFNRGWQFYELPDGKPAIEVPVEVEFDDVLVKGYIDRVMVTENGEAIVVDIKSGSRVPASTLQLGIYALGMARNFGVTPAIGGYWMARKGELAEVSSLLHYTPERVGAWFGAAKRGIEAEVFIPHVGPFCGTCSVAQYCAAVGGSDQGLANANA